MARHIKDSVSTELVIDKSRFVGILSPCSSKAELEAILINTRMKHPKANHVVHAALFNQQMSISDDGEPAKTAASPMLEVLHHHDLINVVILAVRYFGGIKLGAGGLVRAYTKTAAETIKLATLYESVFVARYELYATYERWNKLQSDVSFLSIESIRYEDLVKGIVVLDKTEVKTLLSHEYHLERLSELDDGVIDKEV